MVTKSMFKFFLNFNPHIAKQFSNTQCPLLVTKCITERLGLQGPSQGMLLTGQSTIKTMGTICSLLEMYWDGICSQINQSGIGKNNKCWQVPPVRDGTR